MIITIDGYDGTGKTTLAKKLALRYKFNYLDKPFIKKYQIENGCSYNEAIRITSAMEKKLFNECTPSQIATFYCSAIEWVKNYTNFDIILDRGLLTTYAVVGDIETAYVFEEFIKKGAFHDASIYLIANDEERIRRIYKNNPDDPDLNYPVKWRNNDLEIFADKMGLNYYRLNTNNKTKEDVFFEACLIMDNEINKEKLKSKEDVKVLCKTRKED